MPFVRLRRVALPLATLLVLLGAAPAVADGEAPAELGITPLGHDGSWFELELEPGEQVDLGVEVTNHGGRSAEARSYLADVYSLINGGMGVGLLDTPPQSPVAAWIDHAPSTAVLDAGAARQHTVMVTVPDDASPGRYIAALVVEHLADDAAGGDGADGDDGADGLGIDQVVRQAIAIDITVPGPIAARLELGDTHHLLTGERSTLRTQLDNPGNGHVVPAGGLELIGPDGLRVEERDLELGIVYADTSTHVETILDERLDPGTYTITTTLADTRHDVETTHTSTFEVEAAPPTPRAIPGADRLFDTLEGAGAGPLVAGLSALGLALVGLVVGLARRRRARSATASPTPPPRVDAPQPATLPGSVVPVAVGAPPPPRPPAASVTSPVPPAPPRSPRPADAPGVDTSLFSARTPPAPRRRRR